MQGIAQGWLLFELTSSPLYLGLFSSLRMVMLVSFFILGGMILFFKRLLIEESIHWIAPWQRKQFDPPRGRIMVISGGLAFMLLGILLLARILKWAD